MIIITNKGLVDPLAFKLIGASSKREDEKTIGFFGSGLKYAMAGLLRNNIPFQVWRGDTMLDITTEAVTMRGQEYQRIVIDGEPTSFTTDLGPKWKLWMFIRELYANAIDEGGEMAITDQYQEFITPDRTTVILPEVTPELQQILDEQDILFCRGREVLYENEHIKVYDEVGDGGYYVKGILVGRRDSGFGYETKQRPYDLNEERELNNYLSAQSRTIGAIFTIDDPKVVRKIASRAKRKEGFESDLIRRGWCMSSDMITASDEWKKYTVFHPKKWELAADAYHLPVSDELYSKQKGMPKWEQAEWEEVRGDGTLLEAVAILNGVHEGFAPKGKWRWGKPASSAMFGAFKDGDNWISSEYMGETPSRLAAIIATHLIGSNYEKDVRFMQNLFNKLSNEAQGNG